MSRLVDVRLRCGHTNLRTDMLLGYLKGRLSETQYFAAKGAAFCLATFVLVDDCIAAARSARRRIPIAVRRRVLRFAQRHLDGLCFYCRRRPATDVDHVMPVSRGGDSREGNLVAACHECNMLKLDATVMEWRASRYAPGRIRLRPSDWQAFWANEATA